MTITINEKIINEFPEIKIRLAEPLSLYTNTKTGGPADIVAFPTTGKQAQALVLFAKENDLPLTVIGNASNLIVQDGGIRGLVMILTELNEIWCEGSKVHATAGASLIETTEVAYQYGLTGLEFAAGIPGSIGGAVFMNAGAYGGEIKDVLANVTVVTPRGELKTYTNEELNFGYRMSRLQAEDDIVLEAVFELATGDKQQIRQRMDELNFLRASKQPLEYPSCGSVFKRPVGHFTGKLIHDAGLQGFTIGGAQVSKKHAGFIVNIGGATATDYLAVIKHIQAVILKEFDVRLETEVRIIGEEK